MTLLKRLILATLLFPAVAGLAFAHPGHIAPDGLLTGLALLLAGVMLAAGALPLLRDLIGGQRSVAWRQLATVAAIAGLTACLLLAA